LIARVTGFTAHLPRRASLSRGPSSSAGDPDWPAWIERRRAWIGLAFAAAAAVAMVVTTLTVAIGDPPAAPAPPVPAARPAGPSVQVTPLPAPAPPAPIGFPAPSRASTAPGATPAADDDPIAMPGEIIASENGRDTGRDTERGTAREAGSERSRDAGSPARGGRDRESRDQAAADRAPSELAETGTVRINAYPWAYVLHDGRRLETPVTLTLPRGIHDVTLFNPDLGLRKTVNVTIRPGKQKSLNVRLEPIQ
jgi:hypothetical protein